MSQIGTTSNPLRVAVVGAGPTGFYAIEQLTKQSNLAVEIDLFERLPTPFGLVRYGVAPDHQKIKSVTKVFDKLMSRPGVRFFGNVEYGKHLHLADLQAHYHQIIFTVGAQSDRQLGVPGEDLAGSHPATEFVAWYNGHPDYKDCHFDLSQESVAVIGVGNVAVDVARILCRTPEELTQTDIAGHALEALSHSQVKEVYLIGRRGPAQAAFTTPEVKELGELSDADVLALPDEVALDDLSQAALAASSDRATTKKVELIQGYATRVPAGKSRQLVLRFLLSPVELIGDESGRVIALKLVKNKLVATDSGTLRAQPTGETETIPVGLVFRSIGYLGLPLPNIPFHKKWGVINNQEGRIIDVDSGQPVLGLYTAGWIKRGPTGVIGTNKPDAAETVERMMADLAAGRTLDPAFPSLEAITNLVAERQPHSFSYADWLQLDALEVKNGEMSGRPRLKFITADEMLAALAK